MKNRKLIVEAIKENKKKKMAILESLKEIQEQESVEVSEKFNNKNATSRIQNDVLDIVGPSLKAVPGLKNIVSAFENSYLQILKKIDQNPEQVLTPEQESQLMELIKGFAGGLPFLFTMAVAVSASKDRKTELALQNFKNGKVNSLLQQMNAFATSAPKIDLAGLDRVFSDGNLQTAIQNVFNIKSNQLINLINDANLGPKSKQELLARVAKYKDSIDQQATGTTGAGEAPELQMSDTQPPQQSLPPELSNIISGNFKAYMTKIQQKFGKTGLQALKQAIDSELSH